MGELQCFEKRQENVLTDRWRGSGCRWVCLCMVIVGRSGSRGCGVFLKGHGIRGLRSGRWCRGRYLVKDGRVS